VTRTCEKLKLENKDENICYVQLYFYDTLSSLNPSEISDLSVKHVQGTRFGSIRREICMILRGNPPLTLQNILGTRPIVSMHSANCSKHSAHCVPTTRPIVSCNRLVVACTRPVVPSTDPQFTGFIDTTDFTGTRPIIPDKTEHSTTSLPSEAKVTGVTPRVSKPHDYANHMFMRL
jgi:hypothetical protein